jgi:hypothetical protein
MHLFYYYNRGTNYPVLPPYSPSTCGSKINLKKKLSELGRGQRGKEGERKKRWVDHNVCHLGKVRVVPKRM